MKQRVVVLGVGKRALRCWLKIILANENLEMVALINRTAAKRDEIIEKYPAFTETPFFTTLEAFLESGIKADFCVVGTPPQVHFEQIKTLFENGIDVLTEKPVVLSLQDGLDLRDLAEKHGRYFWVGQNFRYSKSAQYLRDTVVNEKLGKADMAIINYMRDRDGMADWLNKYPLTMEQPMLFEQTEHHYDLVRYCYDTEITKVYGKTMNPRWSMYKNQATVANLFETANGMIINYFGTWSSAHGYFDFQWRTDFEKGIILQKSLFGDMFTAKREEEILHPITLPEEDLFITDTSLLLEKFVHRETTQNEKGIPTIQDNLKTIALMFATLEAEETGKCIYMDEYYKKIGV